MYNKKAISKYQSSPKGKIAVYCAVLKYNDKLRRKTIEVLGGKCAKCGITDSRVLQIDHINGGGCRQKRTTSNTTWYRQIVKDPESAKVVYQILCANCNWIKRYELGEKRNGRS